MIGLQLHTGGGLQAGKNCGAQAGTQDCPYNRGLSADS